MKNYRLTLTLLTIRPLDEDSRQPVLLWTTQVTIDSLLLLCGILCATNNKTLLLLGHAIDYISSSNERPALCCALMSNQSIYPSINQPNNQTVNQSSNHPTIQSINQSIN